MKNYETSTDEERTLAYPALRYVKERSDVDHPDFSDTHDDDTNER